MERNLQKIMVIGAGLGLSSQIAAMFPEPKPARQLTSADLERIEAAERKRLRRQQRDSA